jgi:hypothetical protein
MLPEKEWKINSRKIGQFYDWYNGGENPDGDYSTGASGIWGTMPINHTHKKNENGVYVSGGDWLSYKRRFDTASETATVYRPGWGKAYKGRHHYGGDINTARLSDAELNVLMTSLRNKGAEAWSKMRPDQPDFSLATSLYELREVPRMLNIRTAELLAKVRGARAMERAAARKERRSVRPLYRKAGEWHLALQFGWVPLLSDIVNFSQAFDNKHKRLDQLIRDESRPVYRRRNISSPPDSRAEWKYTSSKPYISALGPVHVTQCYKYGQKGTQGWTDERTTKTWAVGQFRYLLPPGPRTDGWKAYMLRQIMGSRVTPSVVYNLIPYSWLVDYFTDLGKFVDAVSPGLAEVLTCDYAYVMRRVLIRRHYYASEVYVANKANTAHKRAHSHLFILDDVRMRVKATPFGFGLKESDLSLKQASLLGALGLSRL